MSKKKHKSHALPQPASVGFNSTPICHYGPRRVFTVGGVTVWGSNHMEMRREKDDKFFALRIRIDDGFYTHDTLVRGSTDFEAAHPELIVKTPPFMEIIWADYGVPSLNYTWWANLAKYLLTVKGNVVVYCMGGHGRTGTALSILAYLMKAVKKGDDPIEFVRAKYCDKVVESTEQVDYIERITGNKVYSEPSWGFIGGTTGGPYGGSNFKPSIQTDDTKPYGKSAQSSAEVFEIDMTKLKPGSAVYLENGKVVTTEGPASLQVHSLQQTQPKTK